MTASTAAYAIGRGKPPLHTRFQKGQSGNPSGKPGPAKLAKLRFQRALLAALEEAPEALALSKPENGFAAMARQMGLDAAAGRGAAQRLVLSRLDAECERENQLATEQNEGEPFSLVQGESEGGGDDSAGTARPMERYPSPATVQVSRAVSANGGLRWRYRTPKGRGEFRRKAQADYGVKIDGNDADAFSLVQGESEGGGDNLAAPVRAMNTTDRMPTVAPVHMSRRSRLMMGAAIPHSGLL